MLVWEQFSLGTINSLVIVDLVNEKVLFGLAEDGRLFHSTSLSMCTLTGILLLINSHGEWCTANGSITSNYASYYIQGL